MFRLNVGMWEYQRMFGEILLISLNTIMDVNYVMKLNKDLVDLFYFISPLGVKAYTSFNK